MPQKLELQRCSVPAIARGGPTKEARKECKKKPEKPCIESILSKDARRHDVCKIGRNAAQ